MQITLRERVPFGGHWERRHRKYTFVYAVISRVSANVSTWNGVYCHSGYLYLLNNNYYDQVAASSCHGGFVGGKRHVIHARTGSIQLTERAVPDVHTHEACAKFSRQTEKKKSLFQKLSSLFPAGVTHDARQLRMLEIVDGRKHCITQASRT